MERAGKWGPLSRYKPTLSEDILGTLLFLAILATLWVLL